MRSRIYILLLTLLTACTHPIILKETIVGKVNIRMFGERPERNFTIKENLSDSLKFVAELTSKGSYSNTSPVMYDEFMFVPDLSGRVTAFDLSSLKEIGREGEKGETPIAPVLYRTRLFYAVNNYDEDYSTLYYYDYFTNKYIASIQIPGSLNNEMIFNGDAIYIVNSLGTVYKINLIGRIEWSLETGEQTYCDPAMKNNLLVFGTVRGNLITVDVKSEKVKYKKKITESIQSGMTIINSAVLFGDESGKLYSVELNSGNINWVADTHSKIRTIPVSNGKSVYVGNLNGDVYSVDFENGSVRWVNNYGGLINTTPLLFNNVLLQPDLRKKILFINPGNGKLIKSIATEARPRMTPVYFKNKIIFGIDKGRILIYENTP